jgi:CHASE3 domain sensor protein
VSANPPPQPVRALPRLRVGQWLALTIGVLLAFAVTGVGLALLANHRLNDQRHVVLDQVEPALQAALNIENALINEETGVRGYILSGNPQSLEPYEKGRGAEARAYRELEARDKLGDPTIAGDVQAVRTRAQVWRHEFVAPILRRTDQGHTGSIPPSLAGKGLFDAVRVSLGRLQGDLTKRLAGARQQLDKDARFLQIMLLVAEPGSCCAGSSPGRSPAWVAKPSRSPPEISASRSWSPRAHARSWSSVARSMGCAYASCKS